MCKNAIFLKQKQNHDKNIKKHIILIFIKRKTKKHTLQIL